MDQQTELAHLNKAEADIAKARERIKRQEELVDRLNDSQDSSTARSVLLTMRETLKLMEDHRELILGQLAALKHST
jgi:hypothetical protein